jgi:hypothetical protein
MIMPINFNLLRQSGPTNLYEGFVQGQEEQRVNAMAQQKMAQDQEMNALRMQQVRGAIGQQEREVKSQAAAQKTGMFRERLLRARDPNSVRELIKMQYADPDVGAVLSQGGSLEQALAEVPDDPTQFEQYRQQEAMGMAEWMKSQMPKVAGNAVFLPGENRFITAPREATPVAPVRQPPMVEEFNFARSPEGGGFTGSFQDFVIAREAAKRPPAAPRAAGAAPAAAPAAPAPKPMTALQQQATRKAMAADKTSVKASQSVVGELEKLTDELVGSPEKGIRPDPGLAGISGFQALFPSMPKSDARKAQQKLETMKGKVMAFGRQLASLEGKLGNMAVQEWKFVSDSIQAIDPAAGNLDVQLRDIVRQAKNFANTVQERYDLTYEGAEPAAAPTAAPSGAGGSAPAASNVDQERANANAAIAAGAPAAAVRQRFKQNTGQEL